MGAVFRALDTLKIPPAAVAIKEFRLSHLPSEDATTLHVADERNGSTIVRFGAGVRSTFTREKAADLFKREAQILHGFDHPNLPHVSAYFEVGDERYLVMELIEGHDLDQMLYDNDDSPMPEDQVLTWTNQVLDALTYCHRHEIIHRDIKPANIVINLQGVAYLVDFGIARVMNDPSQPNVVGRTAGFSPFEQYVRRGIIDERSDIYSLGATLYNLLTGQVPPIAPIRMDEGVELAPIRQFSPTISPVLEAAVLRALELVPEARFQTAGQMQEAIFGPRFLPDLSSPIAVTGKTRIFADGSGDYPNLQAAVNGVEEGGIISLAPGDYLLDRPLVINRSVQLEGSGMDVTRILCYAEENVATIEGDIQFSAADLTFQHKEKDWADVVVVMGGEVEFTNCRFTGGYRQPETSLGGSGLCLLGNSTARVRGCEVYSNGRHGIEVEVYARATIEASHCSQNRLAGIIFSENASGSARGNRCMQNFTGILLSGNVCPTLEENYCANSRSSGITFAGNSSGLARQNQCEANQFHGISVIDEASPILEENTCARNKRDGISFSGTSSGKATGNQCSNNGRFGLSVNEQANPNIKKNTCSENGQQDIKC